MKKDSETKIVVRKRIIVGNTSRYIPEKLRESGDQFTHKWMIYIRGPPSDSDLSYIKSFRVFIHESFAPNHIVDLSTPPFHITRRYLFNNLS